MRERVGERAERKEKNMAAGRQRNVNNVWGCDASLTALIPK